MEEKEKILNAWRSIPDKNLQEAIFKGIVSIPELEATLVNTDSRARDRIESIKKFLANSEKEMYDKAVEEDDLALYRAYMSYYGDSGAYSDDVRKKIDDKDVELWKEIKTNPNRSIIERYRDLFPEGKFIRDCRDIEADLPWYEAKAHNTKKAYEEYKNQYPGKHDAEIDRLISEIEDDLDWETACKNGTSPSYQNYLVKHPDGKHKDEATDRIKNRSGRDIFLEELRNDVNLYSTDDIQEKVDNGVATWDDLKNIFTDAKVKAIKEYKAPNQLPFIEDNGKTPRGYTEVYFWGTRGTGKTCAIGAAIGYLQTVRKSITPEKCPGRRYLLQLQQLFGGGNDICTLPPGTTVGNLPAMAFSFKDKDKSEHKAMLIDVAGEVFSGIFKADEGLNIEQSEKEAVDHLEKCLADGYNHKIHFFIIEYGNDDVLNVDGYGPVSKSQIMQSIVTYFSNGNLFRKSTISMNVLVTKCDRIKDGDRAEKVKEYIQNSDWAPVVNGINDISVKTHCGGLNIINFSIGEVFAQNLCVFSPNDAEKIISEMEARTYGRGNNLISKIIDKFRQ